MIWLMYANRSLHLHGVASRTFLPAASIENVVHVTDAPVRWLIWKRNCTAGNMSKYFNTAGDDSCCIGLECRYCCVTSDSVATAGARSDRRTSLGYGEQLKHAYPLPTPPVELTSMCRARCKAYGPTLRRRNGLTAWEAPQLINCEQCIRDSKQDHRTTCECQCNNVSLPRRFNNS